MLELCGTSYMMLEKAYQEKLKLWREALKSQMAQADELTEEKMSCENYADNLKNLLSKGEQLLEVMNQMSECNKPS